MELIIGTKNKAKFGQMKNALSPLGLLVQELPDREFPAVAEDGQTTIENAKRKAVFYSSILSQPVLSLDNALYIEGLSADQQPGLNVRHIAGRSDRPTDEEVLEYYGQLVGESGDRINGSWEYGICLAYPDGTTEEICLKAKSLFVTRPSRSILEGFPLSSLQVDAETGQYVSEMSQSQRDDRWQKMFGDGLCEFIRKSRFNRLAS